MSPKSPCVGALTTASFSSLLSTSNRTKLNLIKTRCSACMTRKLGRELDTGNDGLVETPSTCMKGRGWHGPSRTAYPKGEIFFRLLRCSQSFGGSIFDPFDNTGTEAACVAAATAPTGRPSPLLQAYKAPGPSVPAVSGEGIPRPTSCGRASFRWGHPVMAVACLSGKGPESLLPSALDISGQ